MVKQWWIKYLRGYQADMNEKLVPRITFELNSILYHITDTKTLILGT